MWKARVCSLSFKRCHLLPFVLVLCRWHTSRGMDGNWDRTDNAMQQHSRVMVWPCLVWFEVEKKTLKFGRERLLLHSHPVISSNTKASLYDKPSRKMMGVCSIYLSAQFLLFRRKNNDMSRVLFSSSFPPSKKLLLYEYSVSFISYCPRKVHNDHTHKYMYIYIYINQNWLDFVTMSNDREQTRVCLMISDCACMQVFCE